ncbi:HDOD domain-containing protein [Chitinibacter fontanus]|uniref:HDOD domain-containing protein n=1 Tax=Chitinibacter fontanus TaxID=1737446 RepID=A0A7D5VAP3_9NEIS|nr:HDOD domain-containing protein [Chitinibacter fontanus]QLI81613.1 HDOD domain-containing protein [Chitinibacter fontanus]
MLSKPFTDLQQWINYFAEQATPILAHTHVEMRGFHARIDEIGLHEITGLIRHDPLLTLNILRYQEEHRHTRQTTDVTTIDRVLLMIGVVGFFRLFGSLPCLETQSDAQKIMIYGAHRTCARSYLASLIAEMFSNYRRDIEPKEVITAALLHDTAEILLWLASPRQMMMIQETLRSNPSMRSQDVQIKILGCKINHIQQGLVEKWHLPRTLLHLIDDHYADEPRVKIVHLAASIARHLEKGWDNPYFWQDVHECALLFNIEPYLVYQQIRDVALTAARNWGWYEEQPAAALLIR